MDTLSTDDMRFMIHSATSDGDPLDAIEREMIEPAPFTDDSKSGLWLYAWSGVGLGRGRRIASRRGSLLISG